VTGPAPRLDHVQLAMPAGGEDEARRFWSGLLGMREQPKPPGLAARGGVWFEGGIHLGVEAEFRPARKAHPALSVGDLTALADRLREAGFAVEWDGALRERPRFYTADPFGNRVELVGAP
jgi:catechol 2,3-dioxygenase-like lactoylglutathione lyase family enzyme